MIEPFVAGLDVVSLAHLEIFAEVLITAPPVQVNHAEPFTSKSLMEVRVSNIVLFTVGWETSISHSKRMLVVDLS